MLAFDISVSPCASSDLTMLLLRWCCQKKSCWLCTISWATKDVHFMLSEAHAQVRRTLTSVLAIAVRNSSLCKQSRKNKQWGYLHMKYVKLWSWSWLCMFQPPTQLLTWWSVHTLVFSSILGMPSIAQKQYPQRSDFVTALCVKTAVAHSFACKTHASINWTYSSDIAGCSSTEQTPALT